MGGEFTWDEALDKSTLTDITFEAKCGSLTMVVGSVGSGKSSVLGALTGHITSREGSVQVRGEYLYCLIPLLS